MSAYLGSTPTNVLNVLFRNTEAVALYRGSTLLQNFGSSEFSPLDLFAGGKQGVWYDPSDKSTLFQDVAGTVPVTKDGDPVALMRDKSGNNNHATQTVSTSRPVYKTDGVLHWLEFDGVDDTLSVSNGALINNTISVAFEHYDDSQSIAFSEDSTGYYWGYASTGPTYLNLKELSLYDLGLPRTKPMKFLLGMYTNNDDLQRMFINSEVREPETSWNASASNPLLIGVRAQKDRNLTGAMYSFILSDDKILESNIEVLERYTANKAGVTL